ncbi:hypothetical protein G9A89_013916 [Geosiphon pyriformis]|nr:hypothetical protein G9A89_013916 [Geosiphon pyriformis]
MASTMAGEHKEHKIDQLRTFLEDIGHPIENSQAENLLERYDWNVELVADYYRDIVNAEEGLVAEINKDVVMVGSENDRVTSCYIDSVLFAMFARMRAFDGLLVGEPKSPNASNLLVHLRLFVNRLRSGNFLNAQMIKQLRENLMNNGWRGIDDNGTPTQEDTSEFFLFLSTLFELPYLPLGMHLYHGGKEESNDERVVTERLIQLAIPGDPQDLSPVTLEEALMEYFYDNVISGIQRTVIDHDDEKNQDFEELQSPQEVPVSAWQFLKLLPFYSASNEQGEEIQAESFKFPDKGLILPLVLKRYAYDEQFRPFRIKKRVYVPPYVNFTAYVHSDAVDDPCSCGIEHQYRLELRSVVCHIGTNLSSGHYVGYTSDEDGWYKLDDLNVEERVKKYSTIPEITYLFNEFSLTGYLLFYELQQLHPTIVCEDAAIEYDHHVAQNLQFMEFANGQNCGIQ